MNYSYLQLKDRGEVLVAYFKFESILDSAVIEQIGTELSGVALEAASTRKLLLNFQNVTFMSSAMIGKLLQLHRRCKNDKIKLKLCRVSDNLMEVIRITNLHKLFEICKDEEEALASFEKRGLFFSR